MVRLDVGSTGRSQRQIKIPLLNSYDLWVGVNNKLERPISLGSKSISLGSKSISSSLSTI